MTSRDTNHKRVCMRVSAWRLWAYTRETSGNHNTTMNQTEIYEIFNTGPVPKTHF